MRKADSPDPDPYTEHFILVDDTTGAVLFEKNSSRTGGPRQPDEDHDDHPWH